MKVIFEPKHHLFTPLHLSYETMQLEKEVLIKRVGKNIRECRVSQNLSIEKLAHLINMEYSQVSRIERGLVNTSVFHLYRICKALNLPVKNIFNK